jgi:ketosteroid isomerase-like protein
MEELIDMKKLLVIPILTISCASVSFAQTTTKSTAKKAGGTVEEKVMQLERDSIAATKRGGEVAFFQKTESDDYMFVDPGGSVVDKSGDLAMVKAGDLKFQDITLSDDTKVRVYGNTAVVNGTIVVKGKYKDQDISGTYRFTDVFVKRSGNWQIVSGQLTAVMMPGAKP